MDSRFRGNDGKLAVSDKPTVLDKLVAPDKLTLLEKPAVPDKSGYRITNHHSGFCFLNSCYATFAPIK